MSDSEFERTVHFGPLNSAPEERGIYELDPTRLELRRSRRPVEIRPKALQALAVLLHSDGRLVTNKELCGALWGEQLSGWRNNLHQCIRDVRRALNDDARNPRFVETVNRLGYRFIGEQASEAERDHPADNAGQTTAIPSRRRVLSAAFAAGAITAIAVPVVMLVVVCILIR